MLVCLKNGSGSGARRWVQDSVDMNIAGFLTPKMDTAYLYDDDSLRQGLEKMHHHGYAAIPVITQDGIYRGTISEGDFLWCLIDIQDKALHRTNVKNVEKWFIRDLMQLDKYPPVRITATMEQLLERSMSQNFVPVVDDEEKYIGLVTRVAILRYFYGRFPEQG